MGNYPNAKFGPAAAGQAGGAAGPAPAGDGVLVGKQITIDISSGVNALGIDPCAVPWPGALTIGDLLTSYPADATSFTVGGFAGSPFTGGLSTPINIGAVFACDENGVVPATVAVNDGASAGATILVQCIVDDTLGLCVCP